MYVTLNSAYASKLSKMRCGINRVSCKRVRSKNQTPIYCLQGTASIPITVKSSGDKEFLMELPLGKKNKKLSYYFIYFKS